MHYIYSIGLHSQILPLVFPIYSKFFSLNRSSPRPTIQVRRWGEEETPSPKERWQALNGPENLQELHHYKCSPEHYICPKTTTEGLRGYQRRPQKSLGAIRLRTCVHKQKGTYHYIDKDRMKQIYYPPSLSLSLSLIEIINFFFFYIYINVVEVVRCIFLSK